MPLLDAFTVACLLVAVSFAAAGVLELLRLRNAGAAALADFSGLFVLAGGAMGVFALLVMHAMQRVQFAQRHVDALQAALAAHVSRELPAHIEPPPVPAAQVADGIERGRVDEGNEEEYTPRERGVTSSVPDSGSHWGAFNGHPFAAGFPFGHAEMRGVERASRRVPLGDELMQALACLEQTELALRQRDACKRAAVPSPAEVAEQRVELV